MKRHNNQWILLILLILLMTVLGSCRKETGRKIDIEVLSKKIVEEGSFDDEMEQLDGELFDTVYQPLSKNKIKKAAVYYNSGATSDQVVVLEATDEESAVLLKEEFMECLRQQIEIEKEYQPEEVNKLQNALLRVKGKYVILCVSCDNAIIETIIES